MSIYKKDVLVEEFPAYKIFHREKSYQGDYIEITVDDVLGYKRPRGHYTLYSPGSVIDYARENNNCPFKAVERERSKYGARLYWLREHSVIISDSERPQRNVIQVNVGDVVRFHGKLFKITENVYGNLDIKEQD